MTASGGRRFGMIADTIAGRAVELPARLQAQPQAQPTVGVLGLQLQAN